MQKLLSSWRFLLMAVLIFVGASSTVSCAPAGINPEAGKPHIIGKEEFLFNTLLFISSIALVVYVFLIKPGTLKQEERKKFISGLKKNDEVITSGGILGRVISVAPEFVTLEIAQNVRIRIEPIHVLPIRSSSEKKQKDGKQPNSAKKSALPAEQV